MPKNTSLVIESTPEWITTDFLENVLRKYRNDGTIKVQNFHVNYAVPKGESYASVMYRVYVKFFDKNQSPKKRSYVVKTLPCNKLAQEKLGEYKVHEKEMEIYEIVLPELKRLLRSINEEYLFFPACLSVNRKLELLIFDDLSAKGFIMADRAFGLDMVHTKLAINLMAKTHAASMKFVELNPNILDNIKTGMLNRESDAFYPMFKLNMEALVEQISKWEGYSYYADKLNSMQTTFIENALKVYDHDREDDLRALVHGDLWINNIMYKYDQEGKPVDIILLDFQLSTYGSPIIDLIYFFYTSTHDDIRQNCFDELAQYYYYTLVDTLSRLEFKGKIPSFFEFKQQVLRKYFKAFTSSCLILPIMINEDPENSDFEALMSGDERSLKFKKTIMANKKFHKIIKPLLQVFDRAGLLDEM